MRTLSLTALKNTKYLSSLTFFSTLRSLQNCMASAKSTSSAKLEIVSINSGKCLSKSSDLSLLLIAGLLGFGVSFVEGGEREC